MSTVLPPLNIYKGNNTPMTALSESSQNGAPGYRRQETNPASLQSYTSDGTLRRGQPQGLADSSSNKRASRSERKKDNIRIPRYQRIEWKRIRSSAQAQPETKLTNDASVVSSIRRLATGAVKPLSGPRAA